MQRLDSPQRGNKLKITLYFGIIYLYCEYCLWKMRICFDLNLLNWYIGNEKVEYALISDNYSKRGPKLPILVLFSSETPYLDSCISIISRLNPIKYIYKISECSVVYVKINMSILNEKNYCVKVAHQ